MMNDKEAEKRKHLVKTTYRLISERGFSHITLQDVADKAGVSKGIILYYFDNKDDLFAAVLEWLVHRIERHIRVEVSKADTPVEKIEAYVHATFLSMEANREFYRVYLDFLSQSVHHEGLRKFNTYFYAQCAQMQDQIVREGIGKKVFRKVDLEESAIVIRSIIDGFCIRWLFDKPLRFDFYRTAALSTILAYLRIS
jgi:TetR/AcrR family fatty acid metabolism transcriptional regulator